MFNDQQNNQGQTNTDIDHVAQDITTETPPIGLGSNPASYAPVMPAPTDQSTPAVQPAVVTPDPAFTPPAPMAVPPQPVAAPPAPAGLDEIKNQALEQLSPLVGKLEQSPEDRFKTLMMLIQASDNHDLIKEAYEAANAIQDEGLKAEALLGIVN